MGRTGPKSAKARKPPPYAAVADKIAAIEAEMRRIGLWQSEPLPAGALASPDAFGWKTLTYAQWLQFVLVPSATTIIVERGDFPRESALATMAVRNFDGMEEAEPLITLLGALDRLVQH